MGNTIFLPYLKTRSNSSRVRPRVSGSSNAVVRAMRRHERAYVQNTPCSIIVSVIMGNSCVDTNMDKKKTTDVTDTAIGRMEFEKISDLSIEIIDSRMTTKGMYSKSEKSGNHVILETSVPEFCSKKYTPRSRREMEQIRLDVITITLRPKRSATSM